MAEGKWEQLSFWTDEELGVIKKTPHDELLAKIDSKDLYWFHHRGALRAVVELHKPMKDFPNVCGECAFEAVVLYPCPTIQAIEKELG